MALIDDVKVALRVVTDDAGITGQISDLIEEAKLDLIHTANISPDAVATPDALVKGESGSARIVCLEANRPVLANAVKPDAPRLLDQVQVEDAFKLAAEALIGNVYVVEDAAQAIDSYYKGRPLGTIGHLSAFSFHETKNIIAGEGGLLGINDERFIRRSEILWEKGTNRAEFFRGEVNKYGWCDIGSSFLPSELTAAFLWAQLESMDEIQDRRRLLWNEYARLLKPLADAGRFTLPDIPDYATNNAHMFYLVLPDLEKRTELIRRLRDEDILAVFHYLSLHSSPYYADKHDGRPLPQSDRYSDCLVRLPMYYDLALETCRTRILFGCGGKKRRTISFRRSVRWSTLVRIGIISKRN